MLFLKKGYLICSRLKSVITNPYHTTDWF